MPLVSIIVPVYLKSEEAVGWLSELIESIKNQTFTDFEVLLLNDASPFNPNLSKIDDRFIYHELELNSGPALTRNTGAYIAKAEALLPVDSDDILPVNSLEVMYNEWVKDKSKIIYGNIQRLEKEKDKFVETKFFEMPQYSFAALMELTGLMPVTSLHSYECHVASGGWNPDLAYGLEDVEYWVSAGKAGFCGKKVNALTLYYRKHENSRSHNLRYENKKEAQMRDLIKTIHSDIYYKKEFPMGNCGGCGNTEEIVVQSNNNSEPIMQVQQAMVEDLNKYPQSDIVAIEYVGSKLASFSVKGSYTGITYPISGTGAIIPVHKLDVPALKVMDRGLSFNVKSEVTFTPKREQKEGKTRIIRYEPDAPKIARVVESPSLEQFQGSPTLEHLGVGEVLTNLLHAKGWTVEALSMLEDPEVLTGEDYPGIGKVRSKAIVNKARELLGDIELI